MKTQGRNNVHGKGGVRFKAAYTTSKDKSMLRNVVTQLIVSEKVVVTKKVASQISPLADRLVTYSKKGDIAARREANKYVRRFYCDDAKKQTALQKLFDDIAPRYKDCQGGYTRVLKMENRRGDNAPMCLVTFVK